MDLDQYNIDASVVPPSQKDVAGSQYLALVDPVNTHANALNAQIQTASSTFDLASFKSAMAQFAAGDKTFLDGLQKIDFPPQDAADVRAVVSTTTVTMQLLQRESQAPSWSQANAEYPALTAADARSANAANKLRADLGLPKVTS
jgi:hypothetical protein